MPLQEGDKETMGLGEAFGNLLQGFAGEKKIIYFLSDFPLLLLMLGAPVV